MNNQFVAHLHIPEGVYTLEEIKNAFEHAFDVKDEQWFGFRNALREAQHRRIIANSRILVIDDKGIKAP